jgi:hypothetical protein
MNRSMFRFTGCGLKMNRIDFEPTAVILITLMPEFARLPRAIIYGTTKSRNPLLLN